MGLFSQSGDWGYEDNYSYKLGNRSEPMTKTQKFLKLISENPDLPIIPMVDHEVVCEDCGRWLGSFGNAYVGEYALFNDRYYDEREEFKEDYLDFYCDELCEKFDIYSDKDEKLEKYLDGIADKCFIKAIIVNINLPE